MRFVKTFAGACVLSATLVSGAMADEVDFKRFLATPAGAAGVAAMVAGLGKCDGPINWDYAYDEAAGQVSRDMLFAGCEETVAGEDDLFEKIRRRAVPVLGRADAGKPDLSSLTGQARGPAGPHPSSRRSQAPISYRCSGRRPGSRRQSSDARCVRFR